MRRHKPIILGVVLAVLLAVIGLEASVLFAHQDEAPQDGVSNGSKASTELASDTSETPNKESGAILLAPEGTELPEDYDEDLLEELRARFVNPTMVIGDVSAVAGDEVTVRVFVVNNPGVLGMAATLAYDESAMTLKRVENGAIFDGVLDFTVSEDLKNGCRFLWDGLDLTADQMQDGEVLELTFQINPTAGTGKYPISLLLDDGGVVDRELAELSLAVDNGSVTINEDATGAE